MDTALARLLLDWAEATDAAPETVAAAVTRAAMSELGGDLDPRFRLASAKSIAVPVPPVPERGLDPVVLGQVYEACTDAQARRMGGRHYTPMWLARGLTAMAFGDSTPRTVLDPAVGGGVFLLAAADELVSRGVDPGDTLGRLAGIDVDPWAVAVAEAALAVWALAHGVEPTPMPSVVVGDALVDGWPVQPDVVVGNPPFLTPLRTATQRSTSVADHFADRLGFRPGPYADAASLFTARAVDAVIEGGTVALIAPTSVATARDSATVRRFVHERAAVVGVWSDDGSAFEAGVTTFAPVIEHSSQPERTVGKVVGRGFDDPGLCPAPANADEWGSLLTSTDAPATLALGHGTLGDLAHVTAGFRDEYYAIAGAVVEAGDERPDLDRPRVITSGLIDVGGHRWGLRAARIAKAGWDRPVVAVADVAAANTRVGKWCQARLVPKVVVATQTKVIEPAVDQRGDLLPITPVLSVEPRDGADLSAVAAVLLAPPVSRWLVDRRRGSGMSRDAIRLTARDLAAVPLPANNEAWNEASVILESKATSTLEPAVLVEVADLMTRAYGVDADVLDWWRSRAGLATS